MEVERASWLQCLITVQGQHKTSLCLSRSLSLLFPAPPLPDLTLTQMHPRPTNSPPLTRQSCCLAVRVDYYIYRHAHEYAHTYTHASEHTSMQTRPSIRPHPHARHHIHTEMDKYIPTQVRTPIRPCVITHICMHSYAMYAYIQIYKRRQRATKAHLPTYSRMLCKKLCLAVPMQLQQPLHTPQQPPSGFIAPTKHPTRHKPQQPLNSHSCVPSPSSCLLSS